MAGKSHIGIFRSTSPFDVLLLIAGVMPHFVAGAFDMCFAPTQKPLKMKPEVYLKGSFGCPSFQFKHIK